MTRTLHLLACSSIAIALTACGAAEVDYPEQPPMWTVSDADSTITLYPTIHILPADVEWETEDMKTRLAEAEEVWFEIMPGSDQDPALQQYVMQNGIAPGTSLSADLTEEEIERFKAALAPLGMPFEAADSMQPWFASTLISVGMLIEGGFDPASGVETKLQGMMGDKKVRAFETAQSQIQMLAGLDRETQIAMLKASLEDTEDVMETMNEMVADWSKGDVEDLEDELVAEMKAEIPDAYAAIFTERNENWVAQIETEMAGSGTDFMAVGAGHLVGPDGVPAMLKAKGYKVERVK